MNLMRRTLTTLITLALLTSASPAAAGVGGRHDLIVFSRSGEKTAQDIWKMRGDGRGAKRLTHGSRHEVSPVISPDGHWIAFVRQHPFGEASTLWLMRRDGTDKRRFATNVYPAGQLDWSPMSEEIVYVGSVGGPETDLYAVDVSDSTTRRITTTPSLWEREPDWSPNGTQIAYAAMPPGGYNVQSTFDVYSIDADGSEPVQLTDHERNDDRPSWSPDSESIVFRSSRDDGCEGCEDDHTTNLYIMDADGSDEIRVSNVNSSTTLGAEWSPDGERLYFGVGYSIDGYSGPDGDSDVYSVARDGNDLRKLTIGSHEEHNPVLSPDGLRLYLVREPEGARKILRLNIATLDTHLVHRFRMREAIALEDVGWR